MSREAQTQESVEPAPAKADSGPQSAAADYRVGRDRPPVEHRFQPGQSGNPKGRPKGRQNLKTEIHNVATRKVTVRDGEKKSQLSLVAANLLAHGLKGAKGDARSSGLFVGYIQKMGYLEEQTDQSGSGALDVNPYPVPETPADHLLVGVEPDGLPSMSRSRCHICAKRSILPGMLSRSAQSSSSGSRCLSTRASAKTLLRIIDIAISWRG